MLYFASNGIAIACNQRLSSSTGLENPTALFWQCKIGIVSYQVGTGQSYQKRSGAASGFDRRVERRCLVERTNRSKRHTAIA